jgi:hypothetical protein
MIADWYALAADVRSKRAMGPTNVRAGFQELRSGMRLHPETLRWFNRYFWLDVNENT